MGMMSVNVAEDMMTAQAWTPHWRVMPSSPLASSTIFWASGSSAWSLRNSSASP